MTMKAFTVTVTMLIVSAGVAMGDSFAAAVVSYDPGTTPAPREYQDSFWQTVATVPLTNPATALGKPAAFVVEPYQTGAVRIVSPFIPPANEDQIVSLGEGGHLTVRLDRYAMLGPGPDIGLFSNTFVGDTWLETPPGSFNYVPQQIVASPLWAGGVHNVTIDVSADGNAWASLGSVTVGMINNPFVDAATAYATSPAGLTEADFSKPFLGALADFEGKTYAQVKAILDGSAGGTWLDLWSTGLDKVGYLRLSVPDDGDPETRLHFELDAVSVNGDRIGAPVPEPAAMAVLALLALSLPKRGACLARRRGGA